MSKVAITQSKLDDLANAVAAKSGEDVPLTVDEMTTAVLGITPNLQDKTVTPTEEEQTVEADPAYEGLGEVTVEAIDSEYVGSDVPRKNQDNMWVSDAMVTAPAGYYPGNASKSVQTMTLPTATSNSASGTRKLTVAYRNGNSSRYINIPKGYNNAAGYYQISDIPTTVMGTPNAVKGEVVDNTMSILPTVTNPEGYNKNTSMRLGEQIYVSASELVSGDKTISSAGTHDVTNYETATVASGSATPASSASGSGTIVGAINNTMNVQGSVTTTPSVSAGYVASGTSGSTSVALSVSVPTQNATTYNPQASDRTISAGTYLNGVQTIKGAPLQTKSVTTNGDVTPDAGYYGLDKVTVNVSGSTPTLETVTKSYTPSETAQSETITPGAGYDGIGEVDVSVGAISSTYVGTGITRRDSTDLSASGATVTVPAGYYENAASKAVSSGSATPAASISATGATVTPGTNTLQLSKTNVSSTPQVSAGYISSGTAGNSTVTLTANVTTKAAATITPGTSNQTIASGTYLTGTQTISGDANLVAGNIKSGTTIFGVTGSYTGGGSSNWTLLGTKSLGTISTSSTTDTDTGQTIVVTGWNDYDLLVCECSVDTKTNGRHAASTKTAWLTASSNVTTKNGCTFATACWNCKLSSSGTATTRSSTTSYGVYAKAGTISGTNLTITIYQRYNSTQTGTINGSYTMRVYGCKIYDLIGG